MKTSKIDLCANWNLAVLVHGEHKEYTSSIQIKNDNLQVIPATVPGTVELDLKNANIITKDLFFGTNSWEINEYTEKLHCYYFKTFNVDRLDGSPCLLFEGLDCYADIFINGNLVKSVDNMFIEHKIDVSQKIKFGENELFIHIRPAIYEALKYDYPFMLSAGDNAYEQLYVRKPAHMFGWDIMPRYVSAGLYRPVSLVYLDQEIGIEEYYLSTASATREEAFFEFYYKTNCLPANDMRLILTGDCGDSHFEEEILFNYPIGRRRFSLKSPKLWWPNNFGEQNRYDWKITLLKGNEIIEEKCFKQGIASIKLDLTPTLDKDENGKFVFIVNGEPIFIKGANWVPASPFHSQDKERIPHMIDLACEVGCNMLRLWGGNVYENSLFYELCEEKGIMVWQDFGMACGKHPIDDDFCKRIKEEATQIVKRLRHYACIALWSGDNEGDLRWNNWEYIKMDPNENIVTRKVLPEVVMLHDTARSYLPSSPFMSYEYINDNPNSEKLMPEMHYYIWFDFYKNGLPVHRKSKFISEFGSISMPSPISARKFISKENLFAGPEGNDEWVVHSSAPIYRKGIKNFRTNVPYTNINFMFDGNVENYPDLAIKSQIAACESNKFHFEFFRSQKWDKTGMLWWNLIDGWPQLSDATVDFYFDKKLPFYSMQNSMQDVCLMIRDPKENEDHHPLVVINDTLSDVNLSYTVIDLESDTILAEGNVLAKANENELIAKIDKSPKTRFILITWQGDKSGKNHYLDFNLNKDKINVNQYLEYLKKADLYKEWLEKIEKW